MKIAPPHRGRRAPFCACGCAARVHQHEHFKLGHCGACGAGGCPSYLPVNPRLPPKFDDTPNDARPRSHDFWWDRPFIRSWSIDDFPRPHLIDFPETLAEVRTAWLHAWPSGLRFDVRCLDGGAWDRSSVWGIFGTLDEAIACVRSGGPSWLGKVLQLRAAGVVLGPVVE